jgi:membrane protease YdiL (CAAX protease family)
VLDSAPELSPAHVGPTEPAAASPRQTLPIERLGAFIEVLLCSGLPTQLLVSGALWGFGMRPRTPDGGWSSPFVVTMSLIDMVIVLGLICLFVRAHHESLTEFLLGARRPGRELLLGLLLIPVTFVLVPVAIAIILMFKPELQNVVVNPFERMLKTRADTLIFAFVVTFAGGVREEVQRAFIIRRFDQYLGGAIIGIVLYSALFGLEHLDQGYAASIAIGLLGAAWGCLYWIRRSVIAPIVSHAGFNLAQLIKFVTLAAR